jgi:peptidyl-prolyl isomerase H (cyclophilin H)
VNAVFALRSRRIAARPENICAIAMAGQRFEAMPPAETSDPTDPLAHHDVRNPVVFFDISIDGVSVGRMTLEVFADVCPKTAENFRQFCTGEFRQNDRPTGYKNCVFHRIINDFMVQGGDFVNGDGTGSTSIYGARFDDENFVMRHSGAGVLSSANSGKDTNCSQFFITCAACDFLDGKHTVFGKVTNEESMLVLRKLENVPVDHQSRPRMQCAITQCGEL